MATERLRSSFEDWLEVRRGGSHTTVEHLKVGAAQLCTVGVTSQKPDYTSFINVLMVIVS